MDKVTTRYLKIVLKSFTSDGYTRDIPMQVKTWEPVPVKFVSYSKSLLEARVSSSLVVGLFTFTSPALPGKALFGIGLAPLYKSLADWRSWGDWSSGEILPTELDFGLSDDMGAAMFLDVSTKLAMSLDHIESPLNAEITQYVSSIIKSWESRQH